MRWGDSDFGYMKFLQEMFLDFDKYWLRFLIYGTVLIWLILKYISCIETVLLWLSCYSGIVVYETIKKE